MKNNRRLAKKSFQLRQKRKIRILRSRHRQRKRTLRQAIFFWLENDE